MGSHKTEEKTEIGGSIERCFEVITEYETYPEWQVGLNETEVVERDGDGRGLLVRFSIDVQAKTFGYILRYEYSGAPDRFSWVLEEGDPKALDGSYEFVDVGGRTSAVYRLELDPGIWVPGFLVSRLNKQLIKKSLEGFKKRVEAG